MSDQITTESQAEQISQTQHIYKRELLTILMVCGIIAILLAVLYYLESSSQILTKLGDYITNHIL
jgi:uncharacterized membrane protein YidH (DUF202 family)